MVCFQKLIWNLIHSKHPKEVYPWCSVLILNSTQNKFFLQHSNSVHSKGGMQVGWQVVVWALEVTKPAQLHIYILLPTMQ